MIRITTNAVGPAKGKALAAAVDKLARTALPAKSKDAASARKSAWKTTGKLPVPPPKHPELSAVGEEIPEFLKVENRKPPTPEQQAKIDAAMAKAREPEKKQDDLRAAQKAADKEKARARIATLKAKKSGATTAMPLTGKAALKAIADAAIANGHPVTKVPAGATAVKADAVAPKSTKKAKGAAKAAKATKEAPAPAKRTSGARKASKLQMVIDMLKAGATMDALTKATQYDAHSMHGMFYRIRKMGNVLKYTDKGETRTYRIS